MTNQEMEYRLAKALEQTAPNDFQGVLSRCEARKGTVITMTTKKNRPFVRTLIAACLALALIGGGGTVYQQAYAVTSVVSLDVNPSIELEVNRKEKVLSCTALNAEGKEVLADMNGGADLKGTKLDVAVNAIVGALVRNGYLESISSAILISVEDKDQTRAVKLQQELTAAVDVVLQEKASDASVLSQTVSKNSALEKQAKANNISTGKAALVNRAMTQNSTLKFDALAALTVEELKDLVETGAPGMPIGREEALTLAKNHANVSGLSSVTWEVDAELDDVPAHYEIDLYTSAGKLEYKVDAYEGTILQGPKDILSTIKPVPPSSTPDKKPGTNPLQPPAPAVTDIGNDTAISAALSHAGLSQSQISGLKTERDYDDGRLEYEIEFWAGDTEYDYTISGADASVLKFDHEYHAPPATTDIGKDRALTIALSHAGLTGSQATRTHVELDKDDGRLEYEIEFKYNGMEYDYTIDAATGSILEHEKDVDD